MYPLPENIYNIATGIMRYIFIVLGCIIVLRAFFMLRRERRETRRRLRRLPDAGNVGELTVVQGCEDLPVGTVIPVPREGVLGYLRSCDLSLYAPGIRKRHLDFSFENGLGLLITPRSGCSAYVDGVEFNCRTAPEKHPMIHGSYLQVGELVFRLRLFAGVDIDRSARFTDDPESSGLFAPVSPASVPSSVSDRLPYAPAYTEYPDYGQQYASAPVPGEQTEIVTPQPVNEHPRRRRRSDSWDGDWDE